MGNDIAIGLHRPQLLLMIHLLSLGSTCVMWLSITMKSAGVVEADRNEALIAES